MVERQIKHRPFTEVGTPPLRLCAKASEYDGINSQKNDLKGLSIKTGLFSSVSQLSNEFFLRLLLPRFAGELHKPRLATILLPSNRRSHRSDWIVG